MRWPGRAQHDAREDAAAEERASSADLAREMGRVLRETRLGRGLSLGDVEHATRINRLYLEALESARFDVIPAPVYARGFMRSYARYLGLDPEGAVATIPANLPRPAGLEPMPGMRRVAPPALPALPALNAPVLGAIAAVVVLVLAVLVVLPNLRGDDGLEVGSTATQPPGGGTPAAGATVPPYDAGETPDFIGVSRAEAERVLGAIGATPLIVEAGNAAPAGTVFNQQPDAGEPIEDGGIVTLYISQGQP